MKKLFVCVLALTLLCASLCAISEGDVAALASAAGLETTTAENTESAILCDYTVNSSTSATMAWSDAVQLYTVSGDPAAVAQLYVDALSLGGWDSCRYLVGKKARVSFGAPSGQECASLEDYISQMEETLGVTAEASPAEAADIRTYILNTNSKKFHYPGCSSVAKMKDKNKKEFIGTREEVLGMGYDPCGQCNP